MTICPECGGTAAQSAEQCPNCGASLAGATFGTPITCEHCGERISSDAEACPACGDLRGSAQCNQHGDKAARGQCVVCGSAVCEDCNRGGDSHYLCESHGSIPVVNGWAQIYSTSDDLEADLIRENLEAEGVDARVLSQKDHFSIPVDFGELSPVRVLVPAYAFQEAERVLAEHRNASGEVAFGNDDEPISTA